MNIFLGGPETFHSKVTGPTTVSERPGSFFAEF